MERMTGHRWSSLRSEDDDVHELIEAAAVVIRPARLPRPSPRSRVVLFPMDGSRRGLSMLSPRVRTRWLVPAMAVWTLIAAALVLTDGASLANTVPPSVRGTWVSDGARAGTPSVILGTRSIVFQGDSSAAATAHVITRVTWSRVDDGLLFHVRYRNGGGAAGVSSFDFVYEGAMHPRIVRPDDPETVWRPARDREIALR
ncbi:MAG TPA: hypothetical protein VMV51_07505 [Gemmatimonadaceae bacterium]|nr:hypothetical protein [Gemmatimonadaceae bacterium]